MGTRGTEVPGRRRRPRNRKDLIKAAAAQQFYRDGYHRVSMATIAAAVDVTPGALYRHFHNKQELLSEVIDDVITLIDATLSDPRTAGDPGTVLLEMSKLVVAHRELGVLWERESRNLPANRRKQLRAHVRAATARYAELLSPARPELDPSDVDFLTWATNGVLVSPSYYTLQLAPGRLEDLVLRLCQAVWSAQLSERDEVTGAPSAPPVGLEPGSRREALLAAAVKLFNERGYQSVGMDDIGASVGITSASVYNHFESKAELLTMALARGAVGLQLGMSQAMAAASSPAHALELLLRAYVESMVAHPDLLGILLSEVINLPEDQQRHIRAAEHEYIGEWLRLLALENPALTVEERRVVTQAIFTMVNNVARTKHLRGRPNLTADLIAVGSAILRADV